MLEKPSFGHRFGSGIFALALPVLGLFAELSLARYLQIDHHEITRAVITVKFAFACLSIRGSSSGNTAAPRGSWASGLPH